jgi:hypothetical protein
MRINTKPTQHGACGFAVVPSVAVQLLRMFSRASRLATDNGVIQHGLQNLAMLALIGPGRSNDQRDAIAIDEQREFRAFFFPRSTGLGPVASPPPTACTSVESIMATSM